MGPSLAFETLDSTEHRHSPRLIGEHLFAQNLVGAGLVAEAGLFEPGDDVGIEAHRDRLLDRPVEIAGARGLKSCIHAANRIHPLGGGQLRGIGEVHLPIRLGQRGDTT